MGFLPKSCGVSAHHFLLSLLSKEDEGMLSRISSQTRGLAAVRGKLYVYVKFSCIIHHAVHTAIFLCLLTVHFVSVSVSLQ